MGVRGDEDAASIDRERGPAGPPAILAVAPRLSAAAKIESK